MSGVQSVLDGYTWCAVTAGAPASLVEPVYPLVLGDEAAFATFGVCIPLQRLHSAFVFSVCIQCLYLAFVFGVCIPLQRLYCHRHHPIGPHNVPNSLLKLANATA